MSATVGARLGIQVGTILGSIVIALGGLIHLASTARLGDSAGAGEAFMPAIIVRGTIHGMARLGAGVEAIGVAIGDIITIGMVVLAGAGAVEAVGLVRLIQTVVRMDKAVTEILLLYVDMVQAPLVLVVLLFVSYLRISLWQGNKHNKTRGRYAFFG